MTTRTVETPNPATPSASFPLVPLLKPASGKITLTATVYRDSGDDTPTLVTVKDQTGATLGSTTLTTPAGNLTANITIPATALATCQAKPTIECTTEPPIQTSCCTEPIPRTLKVSIETTGTTGNAGTQNYSIRYNESIQTWVSTPSVGGACDDIFIYCHNNTLFVSQSGTCDNGTGFIPDINLESCSPFSLSFTYTADNPPGTDVVVTGTISAM